MDLLVLGGTGYLGRHVAELALAGGHSVVVFHRRALQLDVVAAAEHVIGDRERDLSPLAGRRFDAVVDTSGYEVRPRPCRRARALAHPACATSSSPSPVYADSPGSTSPGLSTPTADAEYASATLSRHGALKAACEDCPRAEPQQP